MMKKNITLLALLCLSFDTYAATYKYDDSNKLQQVTYDNGTVVSYEYDADGNLTKVNPAESSSGSETDNEGTGGGTTPTPTPTPETPKTESKKSSGGVLGLFSLLFAAGLIALRSRFKVWLKSN
jgi:YD repeat-containing protein